MLKVGDLVKIQNRDDILQISDITNEFEGETIYTAIPYPQGCIGNARQIVFLNKHITKTYNLTNNGVDYKTISTIYSK